jgi:ABC-type Fe3+-hydroxamate transport system substrate-binding protein
VLLAVDQIGREVPLKRPIQRVISLVPSQTELLFDLGIGDCVVGRTRFCIHPKEVKGVRAIGGTKNPDLKAIKNLNPDLVIANKEENRKEDIKALANDFPVWVSDVKDLPSCLDMISSLGKILERSAEAASINQSIQEGFASLGNSFTEPIPCAYLIWRKPFMVAGGDTFISRIMESADLKNVFDDELRYPEKSVEALIDSGAKVFLLSSEPYRFRQQHVTELEAALPGAKGILVDGELFSWYGSRIALAPAYLKELQAILRINKSKV